MEDGLFQDSQSQKLKKLTLNLRTLSHQSVLSKKITRSLKTLLKKLTKKLKRSQLLKTLLKLLVQRLTQIQLVLEISPLKSMLKKSKLPILTNLSTEKRNLKNLEKIKKVRHRTNSHFKIDLKELN